MTDVMDVQKTIKTSDEKRAWRSVIPTYTDPPPSEGLRQDVAHLRRARAVRSLTTRSSQHTIISSQGIPPWEGNSRYEQL
jgi:hypothetical protein